MSRPATKSDLTAAANDQFAKLWRLTDTMNEETQNLPLDFGTGFTKKEAHWTRDKNLRDVFIHLYEWHQLLLNWINSNQAGNAKPFLPEGYNWRTYGNMNIGFWEKHQTTPYCDARAMLKESHDDVMKLIETFSNDELFSKNALPWTGTSTLGSYCVSATASHYIWAIKKLNSSLNHLKIRHPGVK